MRSILLILAILAGSCTTANENRRNSELVVTYNGQEVHRASAVYSSLSQFSATVDSGKDIYIIFGADWCKSCLFLYKTLQQSEHLSKVSVLNIDEAWAAELFSATGLNIVPSMVVIDNSRNIVAVKRGPSEIVMHLIVNLQ